jgi:hypothetical protein
MSMFGKMMVNLPDRGEKGQKGPEVAQKGPKRGRKGPEKGQIWLVLIAMDKYP